MHNKLIRNQVINIKLIIIIIGVKLIIIRVKLIIIRLKLAVIRVRIRLIIKAKKLPNLITPRAIT
jgi:hypothetical protein